MLSAIGDHLWQSTVVAAAAALLTIPLRRNAAWIRHAIWLAASLKFLIPFAALVAVGRRLGIAPAAADPERLEMPINFVVDSVVRPFSIQPADVPMSAVSAGTDWLAAVPYVVAVVWAAGAATALGVWLTRWNRIARLVRTAAPLDDDRVLTPLRRLEARRCGSAIRAVTADTPLEPGVFGILRPILVWPTRITGQLADTHIEAILEHELCHVARRDNLWAAGHAFVQTLFWFHPLVWWIGARLVDERERSCDESVVASGREPERYAESILKTCRHSLEAPALCMAGVTGANLEKRMVHIMSGRAIGAMTWWKKTLIASAGAVAVAGPVAVGIASGPPLRAGVQASENQPSFEVASVKPNTSAGPNQIRIAMPGNGRFNITNMPLAELIRFAYELQPFQLTGGPDWVNSQRFDVTATTDGNPGPLVIRQMLQSLLAERFKLAVRTETRDMPIYEMVLARSDGRLGEKLRPAGPECAPLTVPSGMKPPPPPPAGAAVRGAPPPGAPGCPTIFGNGFMSARKTPMELLARNLSRTVRRIVVDKTGLAGFYDVDLEFMPDAPLGPGGPAGPDFPAPNPDAPSIFTALQEQLGLKLESSRGPVEQLVIDRVEPLIPD
jgi:bla regulator protein blaR1